MDQKSITNENTFKDGMVHYILSHSYIVFFMAVIVGVILDIIFPIDIFRGQLYQYVGLVMILLGTCLIYWAQSTASHTKKEMEEKGERDFARGPYKYSRNPTHIGLTIMILGLGFLLNSLFSVVLIIIASLLTKAIFLKEEESLLEEKYGQIYRDYKKKVRSWL